MSVVNPLSRHNPHQPPCLASPSPCACADVADVVCSLQNSQQPRGYQSPQERTLNPGRVSGTWLRPVNWSHYVEVWSDQPGVRIGPDPQGLRRPVLDALWLCQATVCCCAARVCFYRHPSFRVYSCCVWPHVFFWQMWTSCTIQECPSASTGLYWISSFQNFFFQFQTVLHIFIPQRVFVCLFHLLFCLCSLHYTTTRGICIIILYIGKKKFRNWTVLVHC